MTNTNTRTIEGIKFTARDTQKIKVFDKVAYAFGSSAVMDLLNETRTYQDRYMKEFDIYQTACIDFGKIDVAALRKQAEEIAEHNEDTDENEIYCEILDKAVEKVNPPYSKIMEYILDEVGYYHQIQLYDGTEWYDETEIDVIDYDEGEKGTFTLKEDEE
ncbi:hypothetical protein [Solobacterium moorei]|uniref:hypothetical protein n=1 Tax=Solobacterium moorei TaxID=102148 RepID=UPI00040801E1|nr:hypothetical protein [Solobacterium moorei]BET21241.1 hypothetical protein RGT18_08290 [Solobacterium moorei]